MFSAWCKRCIEHSPHRLSPRGWGHTRACLCFCIGQASPPQRAAGPHTQTGPHRCPIYLAFILSAVRVSFSIAFQMNIIRLRSSRRLCLCARMSFNLGRQGREWAPGRRGAGRTVLLCGGDGSAVLPEAAPASAHAPPDVCPHGDGLAQNPGAGWGRRPLPGAGWGCRPALSALDSHVQVFSRRLPVAGRGHPKFTHTGQNCGSPLCWATVGPAF